MLDDSEYGAKIRFINWLEGRVIAAGRGDCIEVSDNEPSGRFWLGRLAPIDEAVVNTSDGIERLEPCAVGLRLRPVGSGPWNCSAKIWMSCWLHNGEVWRKVRIEGVRIDLEISPHVSSKSFGREFLEKILESATDLKGYSAEIRIEIGPGIGGCRELELMLVNTSVVSTSSRRDSRFYECRLEVLGIDVEPFVLEALPDSFRYNRNVDAYGVNCGFEKLDNGFATTDAIGLGMPRPVFWSSDFPEPDLRFVALQINALESVQSLRNALSRWGAEAWSETFLERCAAESNWTQGMWQEARSERSLFEEELRRLALGVEKLESDPGLRRCFELMNSAMAILAKERGYDRWRPFQIGFILANLPCIVQPEAEADIVDIVWFATGGGKTETYLGLLIIAALYDRLRGKSTGITAWTRFPLRLLSLQQLQRFADALAAAELVRRRAGIGGESLSLGFFVGQSSTPNSIKPEPTSENEPDPDDEEMPDRHKVLQRCPFCKSEQLCMVFNRSLWLLEHQCQARDCPWPEEALPFYIVDDEIYRFLPTIVVGTLDKAASISIQAAMRGFVGPPLGLCPRPGHGFTYAARSNRPYGCLVPGCKARPDKLPMAERLFGPSFRLQDELHLLRDSLGAIDAHYEALLDGLELELCGVKPKILASSATLEGYEMQVDVLYRRKGRVFPLQGPRDGEGFWTADSDQIMRRFVAIAPRGMTIDYVIDRMLTELQSAIREFLIDAEAICRKIGVCPEYADRLVSLYGTDLVFCNTLRDLDAIERSIQGGQVQVGDLLNSASLTGRTAFEDVRETLRRIESPEPDFLSRIHIITASSMMSHGVDLDRLNIMIMVGLPLATAEFIQATARVGRRHPGIVFVIHKIGRERDAGIFRSFPEFVRQGNRFVEPIPISRRSRQVLGRTIAGLELARILLIHEPKAEASLVLLKNLRHYVASGGLDFDREREAIAGYLEFDPNKDEDLISDLRKWFERFKRNILQPLPNQKFSSEAAGQPMMSLRDVEDQVPLFLNREP